jgi:hypothetical protein
VLINGPIEKDTRSLVPAAVLGSRFPNELRLLLLLLLLREIRRIA